MAVARERTPIPGPKTTERRPSRFSEPMLESPFGTSKQQVLTLRNSLVTRRATVAQMIACVKSGRGLLVGAVQVVDHLPRLEIPRVAMGSLTRAARNSLALWLWA